jgi:DNA-binding response OmpR family regulator
VLPFLQALWLNSATATIPLIVCTSQADLQVKQLALQLGVCAYINKPFDLHLLTDPIAAQLHQKDLSLDSGTEETSPTSNPNGNSIAKTDSTKIKWNQSSLGLFYCNGRGVRMAESAPLERFNQSTGR